MIDKQLETAGWIKLNNRYLKIVDGALSLQDVAAYPGLVNGVCPWGIGGKFSISVVGRIGKRILFELRPGV